MSGRAAPARRRAFERPADGWQEQAACLGADPEAFFPSEKVRITLGVRRICDNCPVQGDCLAHALTQGEWFGVWGGLSVDERRELARERGIRVRA